MRSHKKIFQDKTAKTVSAKFKSENKEEVLSADIIISATGIKSNIENIGLEDVGIAVDNDKILVNDFYETNIPGYFSGKPFLSVLIKRIGYFGLRCRIEPFSGCYPACRVHPHI